MTKDDKYIANIAMSLVAWLRSREVPPSDAAKALALALEYMLAAKKAN